MLRKSWVAAVCVALLVVGCGEDDDSSDAAQLGGSEPSLQVVASIYPMQYFAERIGGDRVEVVSLVPPGVDGHTFELTPSDLLRISDADVIAMNGLELEPWLERALDSLGADVSGVVVEAADAASALAFTDHGDDGHHHDDGHDDDHDDAHGELDPHVWQDPLRAITQAERIAEALISRDPAGEETYRANLADLIDDLRTLDAEFDEGLASCRQRVFVTSHAAYGYLALRYDLEQITVFGLSPGSDPSPQRLAGLADRIHDAELVAVLVEPVLSGESERVLSEETGAEVLPIHAMDGVTVEELDAHGDYFGLMRDNLRSLRMALDCS